ncbi:MAG: HAD family phosphatase [Desulfobacterales bacterium]|nr:HAD family phosphatase [Desulfobacterales bacterium]
MIHAMIFDLDGTLVQTERLKALSYAHAAKELCPNGVSEGEVIEAFKEVVGLSRQEVATTLMERFKLAEAARSRMGEFGVSTPWQALVQVRMKYYEAMLDDPEVVLAHQWPHNVALLHEARRIACKTALTTMSYCAQARRILKVFNLIDEFDFIATRDDVEHGKPDPEIYELVARELMLHPNECLAIEDSPVGVKAALAAGMWCIAVTTPFTRNRIYGGHLIDDRWVVDDPGTLTDVVREMISERTGD